MVNVPYETYKAVPAARRVRGKKAGQRDRAEGNGKKVHSIAIRLIQHIYVLTKKTRGQTRGGVPTVHIEVERKREWALLTFLADRRRSGRKNDTRAGSARFHADLGVS